MKPTPKPRIPKGYFLEDYDSSGYHKYGVFFYGEEVLFGWEKPRGIRSYQFKIALTNSTPVLRILEPETKELTEVIEFVFTCDLKDYTKKIKTIDLESWAKNESPVKHAIRYDIDLEKLVLAGAADKYRQAIQRIKRKIKGVIPKSKPFTGLDYYKNYEFLEFTEETAHCWAGPHIFGGKKGALAKIKEREVPKYPVLDPRTKWAWYDLPNNLRHKLDKLAKASNIVNGDHLVYKWSQSRKGSWFDEQSISDQHQIATTYYAHQTSYIKELLPVALYLCGSDDCSHTKWFATIEKAEEELKRLRMMQPLDITLDIYNEGYQFTN